MSLMSCIVFAISEHESRYRDTSPDIRITIMNNDTDKTDRDSNAFDSSI